MLKLSKQEAKEIIDKTFEFIDSGVVKRDDNTFFGHPGLFFFRSKEELENKIVSLLNKETYDKYDLYYIINLAIKYMLGKYDSHTKANFQNSIYMPIKFKIQDGQVYIINHSPDIEDCKGATVISVNGIGIGKILQELETITCYSTYEYLNTNQESNLRNFDVLKSLPSISNHIDTITFKILYHNKEKDISFNEYHLPSPFKEYKPKNYSYEILDNAIVVHYNSCQDHENEQMLNLIDNLNSVSQEKNIDNYIIDIRDNIGGDSRIIKPLVEYLKGKNIVVLTNEKVFSSGRMAYVDLKRIGAYSIGTDISTSLNCFGNIPGEFKLDDLNLIVKRSSTYWYYDENFNCIGYKKGPFKDCFSTKKELLEPIILHPDEYAYLSVDDIIHGNDIQMIAAINHLNNTKKL